MRAGDLRERVTIQSAVVSRDAFGAESITWLDGPTVWAQVVEKGGREPMLADRPVMVVGYEVRIRYGVSVSQLHRLMWRGKALGIDAVTPLQAQGLILLRCTEVDFLGATVG